MRYAVAGSSGQISVAPLNHPAMFVSLLSLGSLVLDVAPAALEVRFIDATGAVADSFTIAKNTPTPAPSPTATPLPAQHDTVVLPRKPISLAIAAGASEVRRTISFKVRNADLAPQKESPGHRVRLSASSRDCPAGMIEGAPDFDERTAGDQDETILAGGQTRKAALRLRLRAAEILAPSRAAPWRCTVQGN